MALFGFGKPGWEKAAAKAEKARRRGELATAKRYFEEAAAEAPAANAEGFAKAATECAAMLCREHRTTAEQMVAAGQFERAAQRLELALSFATDADREAIDALLTQAREGAARLESPVAFEEASFDAAISDEENLMAIVAVYPDEVSSRYFELGEAFREAVTATHGGRAGEAIAHFDSVMQEHGDEAIAHFERGRCLQALDRNDDAIAAYLRAEELMPDWSNIKLGVADAALAAGKIEIAEDALQRAVDADDENKEVYVAICRTALQSAQPGYGLEAAEALLDLDPANRRGLILKGQLYEMAGDSDAAAASYEESLSRYWHYDSQEEKLFFDPVPATLCATLYFRERTNLTRAEELARALLTVTEGNEKNAWEVFLARASARNGDPAAARKILDRMKLSGDLAPEIEHAIDVLLGADVAIESDDPAVVATMAELAADRELLR